MFGRRPVFLATTLICMSAGVWLGSFTGTGQWMAAMILNGVGTSAYQAVIQLAVRLPSQFRFPTQTIPTLQLTNEKRSSTCSLCMNAAECFPSTCLVNSSVLCTRENTILYSVVRIFKFWMLTWSKTSLGLISGGSIADSVGWRWSQYICGIIDAGVFVLFLLTFEETLFPRFLFTSHIVPAIRQSQAANDVETSDKALGEVTASPSSSDSDNGDLVAAFPRRAYVQKLRLWVHYRQNRTTFWQYFRRPFFLWGFPNIVIVGSFIEYFSSPSLRLAHNGS